MFDPPTGLLVSFPRRAYRRDKHHPHHVPRLLVIDAVNMRAGLVVLPLEESGWRHAVLARDGKIYAIPGDAPFVLAVEPWGLKSCPN